MSTCTTRTTTPAGRTWCSSGTTCVRSGPCTGGRSAWPAGRDYFLSGPGFVGGLWDANARYGFDVGGRYGTGHIDAQPITDPTGYRRKQDVFGQAFLAAHGDVEVPIGAWTFLAGARLETTYTSGKWLVSQNTFYEVSLLLTVGVRY